MYRQYILNELQKFFQEKYPNRDKEGNDLPQTQLTFGQIIRSTVSHRENKGISATEWLYSTTDEDFFTAMQNAIENERGD